MYCNYKAKDTLNDPTSRRVIYIHTYDQDLRIVINIVSFFTYLKIVNNLLVTSSRDASIAKRVHKSCTPRKAFSKAVLTADKDPRESSGTGSVLKISGV